MSKTVLFQAIQFSISTQFSSIWPINRILSGATTQFQVELYQTKKKKKKKKKRYLIPPCLTFSIIRYGSRVSGEKGAFGFPLTMVDQLIWFQVTNEYFLCYCTLSFLSNNLHNFDFNKE